MGGYRTKYPYAGRSGMSAVQPAAPNDDAERWVSTMLSIYGLDPQVVGRLDALYALVGEANARQAEAVAVLAQVTAEGDHVDIVFAQERVDYAGGLLQRANGRYQMSFSSLDPQSQRDYLLMRHPESLVEPAPAR